MLAAPVAGSAREAGELIEDLSVIWEAAPLAGRRTLRLTRLDSVYVETVDENAILANRPKFTGLSRHVLVDGLVEPGGGRYWRPPDGRRPPTHPSFPGKDLKVFDAKLPVT